MCVMSTVVIVYLQCDCLYCSINFFFFRNSFKMLFSVINIWCSLFKSVL